MIPSPATVPQWSNHIERCHRLFRCEGSVCSGGEGLKPTLSEWRSCDVFASAFHWMPPVCLYFVHIVWNVLHSQSCAVFREHGIHVLRTWCLPISLLRHVYAILIIAWVFYHLSSYSSQFGCVYNVVSVHIQLHGTWVSQYHESPNRWESAVPVYSLRCFTVHMQLPDRPLVCKAWGSYVVLHHF